MSRRTLARTPNPHQAPPVSAATRRDLFGTMGAMLLLTAAEAGPAKAAELDGELMVCCAEVLAIDRESDRLWAKCRADGSGSDPAWAAYNAHSDATLDVWGEAVDRITALPARTPEGLRMKAAAARASMPGARRDDPDPWDLLASSVLNDVTGRAGVA